MLIVAGIAVVVIIAVKDIVNSVNVVVKYDEQVKVFKCFGKLSSH